MVQDLSLTKAKNNEDKDLEEVSVSSASSKKILQELRNLSLNVDRKLLNMRKELDDMKDIRRENRKEFSNRKYDFSDSDWDDDEKDFNEKEPAFNTQTKTCKVYGKFCELIKIDPPKNLIASYANANSKSLKRLKDFRSIFSNKFPKGNEKFIEQHLKAFVSAIKRVFPSFNYLEYNILLVNSLSGDLKMAVDAIIEDGGGLDKISPADLNEMVLTLGGGAVTLHERRKAFYNFTPRSDRCTLDNILSDLSTLARQAQTTKVELFNRICQVLPFSAASDLRNVYALARNNDISAAAPCAAEIFQIFSDRTENINFQLSKMYKKSWTGKPLASYNDSKKSK